MCSHPTCLTSKDSDAVQCVRSEDTHERTVHSTRILNLPGKSSQDTRLAMYVRGVRRCAALGQGKMLPRFERRFRQLDCTLGEIPESIANVKRSVFDPELGVPLLYDPATGLWSYQAQRGRTSRRANLRTLLELQRQGFELRHSTNAAAANEAYRSRSPPPAPC